MKREPESAQPTQPIEKPMPQKAQEAGRTAYNAAQRARGAAGHEKKKLADSASVQHAETWDNTAGHSGTPIAYLASGLIVLGFILGGIGLTVGPAVLIWIGVGMIVVIGAISFRAHVWSDFRYEDEGDGDDASSSRASHGHA